MSTAPIAQPTIDELLRLVRKRYPQWASFEDHGFVRDEIAYKGVIVESARQALEKTALEDHLRKGEYEEFIKRIDHVGKTKGNNLLFRGVPKQGDLGVLYQDNLDRRGFCERFFELVHGEGTDASTRLGTYAEWVTHAGLPNKWTFPTFFLWSCHPSHEVFIKPTVAAGVQRLLGIEPALGPIPDPLAYSTYRAAMHELKVLLAQYGPSDMTDIQSLLWVVVQEQDDSAQGRNYWKIAPGENAWQWGECLAGAFIGIGWDELGDLSGADRATFEARRAVAMEGRNWTEEAVEQVWHFSQIKEGDRIVANSGTKKVLALGEVSGPYYFVPDVQYGHRLPVKWYDLQPRKVKKGGWRKTLIRLSRETFESIATASPSIAPVFSPLTFNLLQRLHEDPTQRFYGEHKEEFERHVEGPLERLLSDVIAQLPISITSVMETRKGLFSRISKNDYGRGGTWDFFWGAIYPKEGKRIEAAQLFVFVDRDGLEFGFYVGLKGDEAKERFLRNWTRDGLALSRLLEEHVPGGLEFGEAKEFRERQKKNQVLDWTQWWNDPLSVGTSARLLMPSERVLETPVEEVVLAIARAFERLFPLVLVGLLDDPVPAVRSYLGMNDTEPAHLNEPYSIAAWAMDTGFEEPLLERWLRAVERKKQAVFYGPPGTGKTFLAEGMARHLLGEGDGFRELVQFHPSYAYEDFMQGIRPVVGDNAGLAFVRTQGRFLEFCEGAARRKGRCVLVIDEINRANLSRVFGELMYLLEYRSHAVPLAGGGLFRIPENVRIIGTMNTADRSIALVDHALRRRFAFIEIRPNLDALRKYHAAHPELFDPSGLIQVLAEINKIINNPHYELGISFFLQPRLHDHIEDIWRMEIEPYLEEYFFDQESKLASLRWDKVQPRILPS